MVSITETSDLVALISVFKIRPRRRIGSKTTATTIVRAQERPSGELPLQGPCNEEKTSTNPAKITKVPKHPQAWAKA
jgi:hypothetical protein